MNALEQVVKAGLHEDGWQVLRSGWPDFLCVRVRKDGSQEIIGVEVKNQFDRISEAQKEMHAILAAAGINVHIARRLFGPADSRKSQPRSFHVKAVNHPYQEIVERLNKLMEGQSLRSTATKLSVSAAYLSDVLAGKRAPGPKLLRVLGLNVKKTTKYEYQTEKI